MAGGMGDSGGGGSLAFVLPPGPGAVLGVAGGRLLLRISRSSGRWPRAGFDEFRRLTNGSLIGWLFDFLRPVGGVERVRGGMLELPSRAVRAPLVPSERMPSNGSWPLGRAACRRLVSTMPADKGYSEGTPLGMEESGREPGAVVSSCILEADNRRTPLFALVLVPDWLRDLFSVPSLDDDRGGAADSGFGVVGLSLGVSPLWMLLPCASGFEATE